MSTVKTTLMLEADGDLPQVSRVVRVDSMEAIGQRVQIRLGTHSGEWLPDSTIGVPYIEWATNKPVDAGLIAQRVGSVIEKTPGVLRVVDLVGTFDNDTGQVRISGSVVTEVGTAAITVLPSPAEPGPPRFFWVARKFDRRGTC